ncbi:MAG: hypothetical protein LAO51_15475 [Acidobacteriia bacterium]|nr:hypothetical protein [Terriglobia bacterium]
MTRQVVRWVIAVVLVAAWLGIGGDAAAGTVTATGEAFKASSMPQAPHGFSLKVKAGGQLEPGVAVTFAGQATHLGQFSAAGQYDSSILQMVGTITVSETDTLHWYGGFETGPAGGLQAVIRFAGGTGRYVQIQGTVVGPVAMDADYMFTMDLEGTVFFIDPTIPVSPCSHFRSYCNTSCEDSTYGGGLCEEASGDVSAISVECCCCTDGFQRRSFIGL